MTTSPPWLQLPIDIPINGVAYWVCQYRFWAKPYIAYWREATLEWTTDITSWTYPWYITPWYRIQ